MGSGDEIAFKLAKRLLGGGSGVLQLHLTMLLEKSSVIHNNDEMYRSLLPDDLAELTISQSARDEIIALLCREISLNPTEALISAVSFTGAHLPTRTVANVVAEPPRPLTLSESTYAFSLLHKFLWLCLKDDRAFLPEPVLARILALAKEYKDLAPTGNCMERSLKSLLIHHAEGLIEGFGYAGIT